MPQTIKNIAILGANKEGLKLLPVLLSDPKSKVVLIADSNKEAMLFKLKELGYALSPKLGIKLTTGLEELKKTKPIHIIINALGDAETEKFLEAPEFKDIEKLAPLSARLLWGVAANARPSAGAGDQAQLLNSLHEIVDAVRLTVDRKELLSVILKLATESTRAERGSIMLMAREDGQLRVEIAKGMDEEVVRKIRVPLGVGISGKTAKEGKPVIISGKAEESGFTHPAGRPDVKSAMCVPLIVNREVIGVVNVSSNESTHVFTHEDLNFLTSLAILAAEVIHRSNEYEKLRVDAAKFAFWKEIDSIISSPQLIDKSLTMVAKRLVQVVPGLTCFIYVFDDDMGKLFLRASSIKDVKGMGGYGFLSLRRGEGIEGSGLDSAKDVILVDRTEEANTRRVYLSLPMTASGKYLGAITGHIVSPRGLSVYHESFLKEIRTLLADSIYKYKQNEKEKTKAREMFAVDEAGLEMIGIKDRKMLMTVITTTPAAIIGAEGSILRLRQEETRKFQMEATFGLDDRQVRDYFLPFEKDTVLEVLRKKEPVAREFSEEASPYIRSILSYPLRTESGVAGVLSFFNKTVEGALYPCAFSSADLDVIKRFAVYAEKALVRFGKEPAKGASAVTLPDGGKAAVTPLAAFKKRAEEELARAKRFGKALVLATIRVAGEASTEFKAGRAFDEKVMELLKKRTRNFDVVVKLNEDTYGVLLLDTNEKITRPLEAITGALTGDEMFRGAVADGTVEVLYGFAAYPKDGAAFADLFSRASCRERVVLTDTYEPEF